MSDQSVTSTLSDLHVRCSAVTAHPTVMRSPGEAEEVPEGASKHAHEEQSDSRPSPCLAPQQVGDHHVVGFLLVVGEGDVAPAEGSGRSVEILHRGWTAPLPQRSLRSLSFPDDQQDAGQLGEQGDDEAHGGGEDHGQECAA